MDTSLVFDTIAVYDTIIIAQTSVDTIKTILSFPEDSLLDKIVKFIPFVSILVTGIAVYISYLSVTVANKSFNKTVENNQLMSKPFLDYFRQLSLNEGQPAIELWNEGLGPAIIKKIECKVVDQVIDCSETGYMNRVVDALPNVYGINFQFHEFDYGTYIPTGKKKKLISLKEKDITKEQFNKFLSAIENIDFKIYYESVYGEEFVAKLPNKNLPFRV